MPLCPCPPSPTGEPWDEGRVAWLLHGWSGAVCLQGTPCWSLVQHCLGLECWSHSEVPIDKCPGPTDSRAHTQPSGTEVVLLMSFLLIPQLGKYLVGVKCYLCQLIIYYKRGAKRGSGNTAPSICPTMAVAMGHGCLKTDSPCLIAWQPQNSILWPSHCLREYDAHSPV